MTVRKTEGPTPTPKDAAAARDRELIEHIEKVRAMHPAIWDDDTFTAIPREEPDAIREPPDTDGSRRGHIMRVTSKGQVTIPKDIREAAGIRPGTNVEFRIVDDVVQIRRAAKRTDRSRAADALRDTRTRNRHLSTDEIMKLLRGDD